MPSVPQKIGKYEILGELGRGAMGTVYRARDPVLERFVALKMMSEELLIEDEMRGRFQREAKSAAALQHPNIVTVFDYGQLPGEGSPYIVMELLGGVSLAALMESKRPERLEDKIHIILQVARGLDYAHKKGVIHRDVKPGNIQVLPDGTAKILDFGIARPEDGTTMKTKTGLVMGTPNYMAPEQITDVADWRADMWAVGIVLYELLTGQRPFTAPTVPGLVYQIVHAPVPPIDERKLGVPPKLVSVVEKILKKDPNQRFKDLAQFARTLEKVMGEPATTVELSSEERTKGYTTNLDLARSLLDQGQPQRALEAARRAQALEPAHRSVVDLIQEIEVALKRMQSQQTVIQAPSSSTEARFDAARWVDEARLALTAGKRTEALRILDDVLSVAPGFPAALELRELLETPARPGSPRSSSVRSQTFRQTRVKPELAFREVATFGEPPGIQVLASSPEPGLVAAGCVDGSVRLWDVESRQNVAILRTALHLRAGHEALVTSLAFSSDGLLLASGHVDGKIHLWDLETREEMPRRLAHDASVGQLAFSPDSSTLASGGLDSNLKLWDVARIRQGEPERRLIREPSGVTALVYSRDGALLVTGHTNRILRVHDVRTGRLTATLRGHEGAIAIAAASPDGKQIATGGRDSSIRIFDLNRREQVRKLVGHRKAIAGLEYFPRGGELATVAMDNAVVLWDTSSETPHSTLWGAKGDVFSGVAVTADDPLVVASLTDGRLKVWAQA